MKYMKKVMKYRLCYMHGEDESCLRGSLMFLTTVAESLDKKKLKMIQTTIEGKGWPHQYVNACQSGRWSRTLVSSSSGQRRGCLLRKP